MTEEAIEPCRPSLSLNSGTLDCINVGHLFAARPPRSPAGSPLFDWPSIMLGADLGEVPTATSVLRSKIRLHAEPIPNDPRPPWMQCAAPFKKTTF